MNTLPRVDLWFELHSNLLWPECESYGKPYIEWLKQQKFPIYIAYFTAWPNKDGVVQYFNDVYDRDLATQKALDATTKARA